MPVTYHVDRTTGTIHTRCDGAVVLDEVLDHFRQLQADPTLPERLDVLLDLDEVTSLPESAHLREVAGAVSRLRGRVQWGACAIVASRDAMFGMSRVFEIFTEGMFARTYVFRTREDAERWLAKQRPPVA